MTIGWIPSDEPSRPTEDVLGVAFAQSYDLIGDAVKSLGAGRLVRLSETHPDLFEALVVVLDILMDHQSRVLSGSVVVAASRGGS